MKEFCVSLLGMCAKCTDCRLIQIIVCWIWNMSSWYTFYISSIFIFYNIFKYFKKVNIFLKASLNSEPHMNITGDSVLARCGFSLQALAEVDTPPTWHTTIFITLAIVNLILIIYAFFLQYLNDNIFSKCLPKFFGPTHMNIIKNSVNYQNRITIAFL